MSNIQTGELLENALLTTQDIAIHGIGQGAGLIYPFVLEWMRLDVSQSPGPKLAALIYRSFCADAVAVFDAKLGRLYKIGTWRAGEEKQARDCYLHDISWYDPTTKLSQRPLRAGPTSVGSLVIYGDLSPWMADIATALSAVAMQPHHELERERRIEEARKGVLLHRVEQLHTIEISDGIRASRGSTIHCGEIELDPLRHRVLKSGQGIHLTPKEFEVLHHLMQNAGVPVPYERLLKAIWGQRYGTEHEYLRTYVRQLRRKIEEDPAHPRYLKVVPAVGYLFEDCQPLPKSA